MCSTKCASPRWSSSSSTEPALTASHSSARFSGFVFDADVVGQAVGQRADLDLRIGRNDLSQRRLRQGGSGGRRRLPRKRTQVANETASAVARGGSQARGHKLSSAGIRKLELYRRMSRHSAAENRSRPPAARGAQHRPMAIVAAGRATAPRRDYDSAGRAPRGCGRPAVRQLHAACARPVQALALASGRSGYRPSSWRWRCQVGRLTQPTRTRPTGGQSSEDIGCTHGETALVLRTRRGAR